MTAQNRVTIAHAGDYFERNREPFFYFADTVWSVFSNARDDEWLEYLEYRRRQGFNALQISALPILHDASDTYVGGTPFAAKRGGGWDFAKMNDAFFARAVEMVRVAATKGFVPVLVLLWGNYVAGTTFSERDPSHIMPLDAVAPYVDHLARLFSPFAPLYAVSGDTNFLDDRAIETYREALNSVKAADPAGLTTFHLQPATALPETFARAPKLDFYMYQAGHRLEQHEYNYTLAEEFLRYPVQRPVVSGEPPYEGHGFGMKYGRFDNSHVRRAFWHAVLSGAKAGFTYGAHGVWSWHRRGAPFTSETWSKIPFDWRTALRFPGAWDAAASKSIFERYEMHRLVPRQDLCITPYDDIRVAMSPSSDVLVLYVPYAADATLSVDLAGYDCITYRLADNGVETPELVLSGGKTTVRMLEANSDALFVATRRSHENR
jgi:Protein of unknown function (DUF4038)